MTQSICSSFPAQGLQTLEPANGINVASLSSGVVLESLASGTCYSAKRRLSAGSFGEVWLCHVTNTGEACAVKVLQGEDSASMAVIATEVINTRRAAESVGRHHIPRLFEASEGTVLGQPQPRILLIAMEFINGASVGALAAQESFPEECAKSVLRHVCVALSRLHEVNIIHRDVKGENVLVSCSGIAYLCDFGFSALHQEIRGENGRTQPQLVGSPYFMAPELLGSTPRYSSMSDMWALGITGIEMALGRPPHADKPVADTSEIFQMIALSRTPTLTPYSGFSRRLRDLISGWLVNNAMHRLSAQQSLQSSCLAGDGDYGSDCVKTWLMQRSKAGSFSATCAEAHSDSQH
mmetsp:Transcript_7585/g.14067  ORF Transcript_7585/g.14067 Transcript_7585/m.14067 type:complete len:351 (-) Transcript_7585:57-1109(-)